MATPIQPNSTIVLLHGVPLEANYENSVFYDDKDAQANDFLSYATISDHLNAQTYVRKNRNRVRVQKPMSAVIDCNYIMFKNTSFENKWFYAFVTAVDYVSNEVTDISFIIDPLQTWMCDIEFNMCFIEREHVPLGTDTVGQWILPEGLDTGPYKVYWSADLFSPEDFVFIIASTWTVFQYDNGTCAFGKATGTNINGLYSGLVYNVIRPIGGISVGDWLLDIIFQASNGGTWIDGTQRGDITSEIVSIFYAPKQLFPDIVTPSIGTSWQTIWESEVGRGDRIPIDREFDPTGTARYTPRNKKLLTAPFQQFVLTDYNGNTKSYAYEYLYQPDGDPRTIFSRVPFEILGDYCTAVPNVYVFPKYYKGQATNYLEGFNMGNTYPQASWTVDAFRSYLANTGISTAVDGFKHLFEKGVETTTPNVPISSGSTASTSLAALSREANKAGKSSVPLTGSPNAPWYAQTPSQFIKSDIAQGAINSVLDVADAVKNAANQFNNLSSGEQTGVLGAIAGGGLLALSGNAGAILNSIYNEAKTLYEYSLMPNHGLGTQTGFARGLTGLINVGCYHMGITSRYAWRIDRFFDLYGYRVDRVGTPVLWTNKAQARPHWNYIKTANASIKNKFPYEDYNTIVNLFDNGIRFWNSLSEVGNYEQDNADHTDDPV